MLTFLICIKHPENAKSYKETWDILENTLESIHNQSDRNFNAVVVCNEARNFFDKNKNITNCEFIELPDWQAPCRLSEWGVKNNTFTKKQSLRKARIDKGCKYLVGLNYIHKHKKQNHYVMPMDGDDFVHKDLAKYVNSNSADFYAITKGYKLGKNLTYQNMENFNTTCGTSNIFNLDLISKYIQYEKIPNNPTKKQMHKATKPYILKMILGAHRWTFDFFTKTGHTGEEITSPFSIYNCSHNDQHSRRRLYRYRNTLTQKMIEDFGLFNIIK